MTTLIPQFDLMNGGTTPTGAVNRPINQKLSDIISVLDFGADPTGIASSVTAFQNAINATPNIGIQTILVPTGTYLGDMTTLTYGSRKGFVWEELGVTYSTAAPQSTVAQGVGLVVTRTNVYSGGSSLPTTVGQVGFEYSPLGLAGENSAVVITKNSAYTSGTSNNPSALLVTTNITANGGTKDNCIIGIINDSSTSNVGNSRTAHTAAGVRSATNGSNFIVQNITASDTTTRKSSVSTGSLIGSEIDISASGPDDVALGVRGGIQVSCSEYASSVDGQTTFGAAFRTINAGDSYGTGNSTWNYGFLVTPQKNSVSPNPDGIINAFAVNGNGGIGGGNVTNVISTTGITGPVNFSLGTKVNTGTIFTQSLIGKNSSSGDVPYVRIQASIVDNTSSSETGQISF